MGSELNFRHLNLEHQWPSFALAGLRIGPDGELGLPSVPLAEGDLGPTLDPAPGLVGPAGIGVDETGNLFLADPANHRVLRVDGCDGTTSPLPCLGGPGSDPGRLREPRGVLVGPSGRLYVADSGNHRIQVLDLATLQVRGAWGQRYPWAEPEPDGRPGGLHEPWDLVADAAGFVYVSDHGNRRVQKFDPSGMVVAGFWDTVVAQSHVPTEPGHLSTGEVEGGERLLVVDRVGPSVLVYTPDGVLDWSASEPWHNLPVPQVDGLAYHAGILYVGDAAGGRILVFDGGGLVGEAAGFRGPVAYLVRDRRGGILVHPGGAHPVARLALSGAFTKTGSFVAGPFSVGDRPTSWHRLEALADPLPAGTHVRFSTLPADTAGPPPTTSDDRWRAAPRQSLDFLVFDRPARYLWLRGELWGDGTGSPVLRQIRLDYEHESYLRHLPAVYSNTEPRGGFLERALDLFESFLAGAEGAVDALPHLFDAGAAPDRTPGAPWLDWLSSWLAFELDESWDAAKRRHAVADAFALSEMRGTVEGLRRFIALYTGAAAHVHEPVLSANVWSLGETSVLGFTTMLAAAEAQGAVLGRTATLDHSHLLEEGDDGSPLFDDIAHRFCVEVYEAEAATPDAMDRLRAVIDREKPAHTSYDVCVVGPRARVGLQARLGVDAVVAGPPPPLVLGSPALLGRDSILPASRSREPRVGRSTTVG